MRNIVNSVIILAGVLCMPSTWAHRYIENDGTHTSAESAIPIGDIDVSQVAYHEAKANSAQLWLSFEAEAGIIASIQIGVPKIDRYASLRPAFILLGPGLPSLENPPVEVPEGYGGIVCTTDTISDPEVFDEHFTGTVSWIFDRQEIPLPASGLYYIVTYVSSGEPGKFWVAPGVKEVFGFGDILTLPGVIYTARTFHEVFFWGGILGWGYLAAVILLLLPLVFFFNLGRRLGRIRRKCPE